jgi:hypothetical protein
MARRARPWLNCMRWVKTHTVNAASEWPSRSAMVCRATNWLSYNSRDLEEALGAESRSVNPGQI